ncbi:hypothetical protein IV102_27655 [bacterium]|nr:hypothetical protein [bacterium]
MSEGYASQPESDIDLDEDIDLVESQLNTHNSVHDRTQFESKFDFEMTTARDDQKSFEVDMYVFFPKTMGVSSESYPREAFYGDITHLLRVRTPEVKRGRGGAFSTPRLSAVEEYFKAHLDTVNRQRLSQLVVHDTKLFGCLVYTELKRVQSDLRRVIKRANSTQNSELVVRFQTRLMSRVESVHAAIREYRQGYVWRLKTEPLLVDEEVRRALLLIDEYLSYRLESALIALHRLVAPFGSETEDLQHQVEALLTGEMAYRLDHVQAAVAHQQARVENHYYRLGLLKKYVSEVLFLQTKRINKDYVYRNFIAAFGAALAAAFAILTNVQTARMVLEREDIGLRLLTVTVLGVIAYVFKDRIKDVTKDYFNSRLKSWMPDFDVQMFYTHFDSAGRSEKVYLGSSQELVRYLQRSSIPPDIDYLRELGHRTELEPERLETVLHYNKRMRFEVQEAVQEHFGQAQVKRIHDVLRFDISHFLAKLADPQKRLSYFSPDQGIVTTEAPRVYHLNLVFRYRVSNWLDGKVCKRVTDYERLRVILNKQGIVRVESVVPRGELGHEEQDESAMRSELLPLLLLPRPARLMPIRAGL